MLDRAIEQKLFPKRHPELARKLTDLRAEIATEVRGAGLADQVAFFDETTYNPALPVAENLIFAMPLVPVTAQVLIDHPSFALLLDKLDLEDDLLQLAADIVDLLDKIFGVDGTDHPLFRKLGLQPSSFEAALELLPVYRRGAPLSLSQKAQLLAVPLVIPAEKIGPAFPADIMTRVMQMRRAHSATLQETTQDIFVPLSTDAPVEGLSVLENALFGKIKDGVNAKALLSLVGKRLRSAGLQGAILGQLFYLPVTLGGRNLSAMLSETVALGRATVKRPDVLILDQPLASFDAEISKNLHVQLRNLLPQTIIICLGSDIALPERFDHHFLMQQGRLSGMVSDGEGEKHQTFSADMARKLRALQRAELLSGLARKQLQLLAFLSSGRRPVDWRISDIGRDGGVAGPPTRWRQPNCHCFVTGRSRGGTWFNPRRATGPRYARNNRSNMPAHQRGRFLCGGQERRAYRLQAFAGRSWLCLAAAPCDAVVHLTKPFVRPGLRSPKNRSFAFEFTYNRDSRGRQAKKVGIGAQKQVQLELHQKTVLVSATRVSYQTFPTA